MEGCNGFLYVHFQTKRKTILTLVIILLSTSIEKNDTSNEGLYAQYENNCLFILESKHNLMFTDLGFVGV